MAQITGKIWSRIDVRNPTLIKFSDNILMHFTGQPSGISGHHIQLMGNKNRRNFFVSNAQSVIRNNTANVMFFDHSSDYFFFGKNGVDHFWTVHQDFDFKKPAVFWVFNLVGR